MKISGIYKIESDATKKIYIGESVNITKRKLRHFGDLRYNKHKNKYNILIILRGGKVKNKILPNIAINI